MLAVTRAAIASEPSVEPEHVLLLHGLGRTRLSMQRIANQLEREGFRVTNLSYPSRTTPLEDLAADWLPAQLAAPAIAAAPRVHIVTHSLGGILVRLWLRDNPAPANLGRVVMLAPPNAGSEVPDRLRRFPPFRWFTGLNGRRLGTGPADLPRTLGPWPGSTSELGIIAGNRTLNPLFSSWLPGADDGKVTVASTHLEGERAHVVLPYSHTWLGYRFRTLAEISGFLRTGGFSTAPVPAGRAK